MSCAVLETQCPPSPQFRPTPHPDEPPPIQPSSKTDTISSSEVAWAKHQDFVPPCLKSHMSPPICLSQKNEWGGEGGGHVPSLKGLQALVGL